MKLIIVDKKHINTITLFFLITLNSVLSGCQKVIYIHDPIITPVSVNQKPATNHQPAQFYVCGNDQYPCVRPISSRTTMKDPISIYAFKPKGVVNENHVTQKNTVCQ